MKKNKWAVIYGALLTAFTVYISLDTFVIGRRYRTDAAKINTSMFTQVKESTNSPQNTDSAESNTDKSDSGKRIKPENKEQTDTSESTLNRESTDENAVHNPDIEKMNISASIQTEESTTPSEDTPLTEPNTENSDTSDSEKRMNPDSKPQTEENEDTDDLSPYSYKDENIKINLTEYNQYNTKIYVADVLLSSAEYLKTAFAEDTYGRNVTENTSDIAAKKSAVLAVNGDYYGAQERGYVIRNGIVYRDAASGNDLLCIYANGSADILQQNEYSAEDLVNSGVWQAFSFGPGLIENGEITVSENDKVDKEWASNPRTAVGIISANHFLFVVADGRTDESKGLSLYQLAQFMQNMGASVAYNLDGGGSSTMYFNGKVINKPTFINGIIEERQVSDIVYIG